MSDRYAVTSLDELVGFEIPGQARWHRIRSTLDVGAFGINAWTATEDGQQVIGEHEESSGESHEEIYVVLSGEATFTLDGEEVDAPQGTVVHDLELAADGRDDHRVDDDRALRDPEHASRRRGDRPSRSPRNE